MNNVTTPKERPAEQSLAIVLAFQVALFLTVFLNIAIARQIIGFLYLTFIPGYVVLKLLKMDKLDIAENTVLSVGFSITFLMVAGLLISEIGPSIAIRTPLETTSLIMPISGFVLIGAIVHYLRNSRDIHSNNENTRIPLRSLIFLILPILSITGAVWVNIAGNNSLLLLMTLVVAAVFLGGILSERIIPPEFFALAIFSISFALLFHTSLISSYINGNDLHIEYYVFKITQNQGSWTTIASAVNIGYGRFSDMLSVTILPTVYSNILNIDGTWIFKIAFPLIFSLVPVTLFKLWETNWGKKIAFVSALLLISQVTFYTEIVALARQMIAELFFALLLFVLFSKKLNSSTSKFCFVLFSIALIVSHYAMALIFLFFIFGTWLLMLLVKKRLGKVTLSFVAMFAVLMFFWYIFTSSASSFQNILDFGRYVYGQLGSFSNPASRGSEVMIGLGMQTARSTWQTLSRFFAYATELFIGFGFIYLVVKRKEMKTDWDYFFTLSLGITLLAMTVLLPGLALTLQMTRFYHISLLLIAPLFAVGFESCFSFFKKKHVFPKTQIVSSVLLALILVAYFLFQTGFVYEVVGDQIFSLPLSGYHMDRTYLFGVVGYVDEQSVQGSQWLSRNIEVENATVYDATAGSWVLLSYGGIYAGNIYVWTNTTTIGKNGVLYLDTTTNYTELYNQAESMTNIYSNGGADVWLNPIGVANP